MIFSHRLAAASLAALVLLLSGCKGKATPSADTSAALPDGHVPVTRAVPLDAKAQAAIDEGNRAFAAKDYPAALAAYRRTLEIVPGHPAPWWGISMAANMMGDSALADTAMRMLKQRGVEPGDPTHTPSAVPFNPHGPPGKTS